jgi:hypothetical protein
MDMSNQVTSEHFLSQIDRLVDWAAVAPLMRAISVRVHADVPMGALKMLLLARWYGMSEEALLEACQDRLSFRRFLGLQPSDTRDDARHAEAYRRNIKQAPVEAQNLIHGIEAQLLVKGYTVKPGMSAEPEVAPTSGGALTQDDADVGETAFFPPGDLTKLGQRGGDAPAADAPVVEDNGDAASAPQPVVHSVPQPTAASPSAPVKGSIEWPWGVTTMLEERLNIGREFGFCPFAQELQPYRHLSRRHAELQVCDSGIWVRDLHSHNRTFVNDEEVPPGQAYLVDSDSRIRFGPNFVILLKLEH